MGIGTGMRNGCIRQVADMYLSMYLKCTPKNSNDETPVPTAAIRKRSGESKF